MAAPLYFLDKQALDDLPGQARSKGHLTECRALAVRAGHTRYSQLSFLPLEFLEWEDGSGNFLF